MFAQDALDQILQRFEYLEARLMEGASGADMVQLSRDYAELKPVVTQIMAYRQALRDREEALALRDQPDMRELADEELTRLDSELPAFEQALRLALLPRDSADAKPALIELRPGTGGEEASLFAADLLRMYQRYAEARGWQVQTISYSETELGGLREAVIRVAGEGVFARLKFESGVHRVQRVPVTESGGRIHTSAATVAVLPEAAEVEIDIPAGDIRIDTMRASGAGGQHVNTTDSAVRITHIPSGIVVTSAEKSQHQNRAIAMQVLRAKLFDMERQRADAERADARRSQVGSGDRSERIRTYNFPQGRMTDHRINLTLYKLDAVMAGDLDEVIDALIEADQTAKLAAMDG
ncbi:Peptide chain release factor RF1 [Roseibaca ekhonensis]|uniref:Peptide chain release factor 1 n=1 Tax=Roseinatronobacter ekhonensis TaxID=254356 RepID=A0A3B0MN85_9RHOB|nr:peptide chain release factor 1 [Roseibaca ekhonensis]SUZ32497.1 Peptide chain release factor RF1 [Roseibaca ekhonensis]